MSYSYEILHETYVKENDAIDNGFVLWHIGIEICDQYFESDIRNKNDNMESFQRCRKWLLENHSELMV